MLHSSQHSQHDIKGRPWNSPFGSRLYLSHSLQFVCLSAALRRKRWECLSSCLHRRQREDCRCNPEDTLCLVAQSLFTPVCQRSWDMTRTRTGVSPGLVFSANNSTAEEWWSYFTCQCPSDLVFISFLISLCSETYIQRIGPLKSHPPTHVQASVLTVRSGVATLCGISLGQRRVQSHEGSL